MIYLCVVTMLAVCERGPIDNFDSMEHCLATKHVMIAHVKEMTGRDVKMECVPDGHRNHTAQ